MKKVYVIGWDAQTDVRALIHRQDVEVIKVDSNEDIPISERGSIETHEAFKIKPRHEFIEPYPISKQSHRRPYKYHR